MALTEKQRAHARRNALQDAPAYAKGRTVTLEKINQYTEYQANLLAPRRQPAYHQWKEEYRYHFAAYMVNAKHLDPTEEAKARAMLEKQDSNTEQATIRAGKDEHGRPNVYAIWQTNGTWYSAQIWQAQRGAPLDRGEAVNLQAHATRGQAFARRKELADAAEKEPPAPKVQVTKDGPAYLLPGIEPASKQEGDTEQLALC